jgi:hypothetical protein
LAIILLLSPVTRINENKAGLQPRLDDRCPIPEVAGFGIDVEGRIVQKPL